MSQFLSEPAGNPPITVDLGDTFKYWSVINRPRRLMNTSNKQTKRRDLQLKFYDYILPRWLMISLSRYWHWIMHGTWVGHRKLDLSCSNRIFTYSLINNWTHGKMESICFVYCNKYISQGSFPFTKPSISSTVYNFHKFLDCCIQWVNFKITA